MTRNQRKKEYIQILDRCKDDKERKLALRELCKQDLFFLLVNILGRADIDRDWLFDRCVEVQLNPNGYLDLWARDHWKSSIITFGKSIQDILINPDVTIGLFSHTRPIAKAFLRQIKSEFESNIKLKNLFPDVLWENPKKEAPLWSEDAGIVVKRSSNPKESTVEAWGLVEGQCISKHFKIKVYDDVVTKESVSNPDMISKVTESWELSLSLGSEGGWDRYIGTRYHYNDTYKTIMERGAAIPRIYPATHDGTPTGRPVLLTQESLDEKRRTRGPYTFASQYLQNPIADSSQGFSEDWLKFWDSTNTSDMNIYVFVDPANSKKKGSDYTAMFCVGLGRDRKFYVIDMVRDRLNLTERTNRLFSWHQQYRVIAVFYERFGMLSDISHIQYVQEQKNYRFEINEIKNRVNKEERIKRLVPIFEQRRIYLPRNCMRKNYEEKIEDLTQVFINEEYKAFPVSLHDDMLDCLAQMQDPEIELTFPLVQAGPVILTRSEQDWANVFNTGNETAVHCDQEFSMYH